MSNGMKALDDVIREIIYNLEIHDLMVNPYRDIVQFQGNECEGMTRTRTGRTVIEKEGFQIGEPFDGDIEKAPVLFLSSNPAFNFDEVSPRYFPSFSKIFMPEHIASAKKAGQKAGMFDKGYSFEGIIKKIKQMLDGSRKEISFEEIQSIFTVPQREMTFGEIREFFKTRIQTSPARNEDDETLRIPLKNGETAPVKYWTSVKNNTEVLLPSDLTDKKKGKWAGLKPSERAREIMRYAVCMEIVPFRSNSEIGVNEKLLNECWEKYTKHLLALSGASVIILVGNKVLDVFTRKFGLDDNAQDTLKTHGIVEISIGSNLRKVVKVDFNMGAFSRLDDTKLFSPVVLSTLCCVVAGSPFVTRAINAGSD